MFWIQEPTLPFRFTSLNSELVQFQFNHTSLWSFKEEKIDIAHLRFKQQSLNYSLNMSEKSTPINYTFDLESLFQCDAELSY